MVQRTPRDRFSGPGRTEHRDGPTRMCVGCRDRAGIADLVRVVARGEDAAPVLVVDHAKTMPGRGAWLHQDTDCVSAAVRRKAFRSALRQPRLVVDLVDLLGALDVEDSTSSTTHDPRGSGQVAEV